MVPFLFLLVLFMVISPGLKAAGDLDNSEPQIETNKSDNSQNLALPDSWDFYHKVLNTELVPGKILTPGNFYMPESTSSQNESGFFKIMTIKISPEQHVNYKKNKGASRDAGL